MNTNYNASDKNNCCCCQPIFWPLCIVFMAFIIAYTFQISLLWQQRTGLKNRLTQLEKMSPQVQLVNGTLGKLSRELLNLAGTNEEARKIVADFRIQTNPTGAATPTEATSEAAQPAGATNQ